MTHVPEPTPVTGLAFDPSTPLYRVRPFALLFTTRLASNIANHMLAVAIGYQVYELTDSALNLGLIGLVQFLPPLLLMLPAGQVADRYNRRFVLRCCFAIPSGLLKRGCNGISLSFPFYTLQEQLETRG